MDSGIMNADKNRTKNIKRRNRIDSAGNEGECAMRGQDRWNYKPYKDLIHLDERLLPMVSRVAPGEDRITFEWYDNGDDGPHEVFYRLADEGEWRCRPLNASPAVLEGLMPDRDHEFYISRQDGTAKSVRKYARTGFYPGTIICYIHPRQHEIEPFGSCPSSPTLCRLPSGALLSGCDIWSQYGYSDVAQLFRSDDEGQSWRYVTDLCPCIWPKLFVHRGKLYALSCASVYGDLQITCSEDEGETWSAPRAIMHGFGFTEFGPHKAPVPVVEHKGRLYTSVEFGSWKMGDHQSTLLSIDADADLMQPENWQFGPLLKVDPSWPGVPQHLACGYIEGNAVVGPDDRVYNMLRFDYPGTGKACLLRAGEGPEDRQVFEAVVDCPVGANSKFEVQRDPVTGKYIAIGTEQLPEITRADGSFLSQQRLLLSMAVSDDLRSWKIVHRLFDYRGEDPEKVGFQYPSWLFSGDDIYVQTRLAFNGADTYHNGNCEIFSVVRNFRQYL